MIFDTVHLKPSTDRMAVWRVVTRARMPLMVTHPAGVTQDPLDRNRRWKRSLRAPMTFRLLSQLLARNVSASHWKSPA